jgi:hypothetical protein
MKAVEKKHIEMELRRFTAVHFQRPTECRNLEQIRFYVRELSQKIEAMEKQFNYVPGWAYSLLAQYNEKQNSLIDREFRRLYCS